MLGYMETRKAYTEYFKPPSFSYHIKASIMARDKTPKGFLKLPYTPKPYFLPLGCFVMIMSVVVWSLWELDASMLTVT